MIENFWFVRLDEGEMWKNVVWKWRKCQGQVEEGIWSLKICSRSTVHASDTVTRSFASYKFIAYFKNYNQPVMKNIGAVEKINAQT